MSNMDFYKPHVYSDPQNAEWFDWDDSDYVQMVSKRQYHEVGNFVTERPAGDYSPGYVKEVTTVYLDPSTGLLVADIPQYEKWITNAP